MIFSPAAGVLVVFLKNLMYFVAKGATDPVGVVANFIAGTLYVFPVAYLYRKYSGINSIVIGLTIGTVVTAVVMTILNYFIILPAYGMFVGVGFTDTAKWIAVIGGVLPFNFIKGVIVSILFVPLFFKLKEWIEKKKVPTSAA